MTQPPAPDAKGLPMRSLFLLLAASLSSVAACSLVLDTESLQKKGATVGNGGAGGGGAGGEGGTAGGIDASPGDANPEGGGQICQSDVDCQPVGLVVGCTAHVCGPGKTCLPPQPFTGLGVDSIGDVEEALIANEIGHPTLLADQTDIVLSVWHRSGTANDLYLRRYDQNPNIAPIGAHLGTIAPGRFDGIASSAGIAIRTLPRRIRLLFAARAAGATAAGMHQLDVDFNFRLTMMQPVRTDIGVTGYDTHPRGPVPRLLPGLQEPAGMWIQQGKLFYADAMTQGEVFSAKRVVGFAPLAAIAGLHAALETTDLNNPTMQGATELWTRGVPSLASLSGIGDQLGALRRGVSAAAITEGVVPLNLVIWSFERSGTASLQYAGAVCDLNQCTAAAAPMTGEGTLPAAFPEAATGRVMGNANERDLAVIYQITTADPAQSSMVTSALLGGITRITVPQGDAGSAITSRTINPATFLIAAASGVVVAPPGGLLAPSAVAMTNGGMMMAAWVESRGMNQTVLKTRRFMVKTCPPT